MTDLHAFIENLMNALLVVVQALENITFSINLVSIRMIDFVVYGGIVSTVLSLIKRMSYHGLFTISKDKREKLDNGN